MEPTEDNLQMLVNMGFSDLTEIKRALTLSKNDVNEAVAILTNEQPGLSYDTVDEVVEMMEDVGGSGSSSGKSKGERSEPRHHSDPAPPSYDEAVEPEEEAKLSARPDQDAGDEDDPEVSKEFPATNLYELEGRVFTDQWSIPYKKEESLGKCLIASTRFAKENLIESDENCKRFVSRCMPEAIKKLMVSNAVHRWGAEIQEGIYNMLQLTVDLVAARLKHKPVPVDLLGVLTMVLNPETEFHYKNRSKHWDKLFWEDKFGMNNTFAVSPPFSSYKDPCGWLVNLINRFGEKGGFEELKTRALEPCEELDPTIMAALLQPLGVASEYLNTLRVAPFLGPVSKRTLKYVRELADSDLKQKKAGSISDLLSTMKLLCMNFWAEDVSEVDTLRLDVALRMLKSPHFNAKMNSLKEIAKLIEDSSTRNHRTAIQEEVVLNWLVDKKVLSIALDGNIDKSQYCDRLKGIVVFLGTKLSQEELTGIWNMQNDQPLTVVENIHSIMSAAAVKFNTEQLEHLFYLIQKAWTTENDRIQEKLLSLIGRIGREVRNAKTTCKVLELLWDLAHLPAISTPHLQHALEEQLAILCDSITVNMTVKQKYISRCVGDIKKGSLVVPALRQLHSITRAITKQSYTKDKGLPQELNKNYDIIKLTTQSLLKYHKMAVTALEGKPLGPQVSIDGRYTHEEYVDVHLRFLAFILQEGALYLHWHRSREIWDCLVANPDACELDQETCFEWFRVGLTDLEQDTQMQLFKEKLLKLDPTTLSPTGFECVKTYFETVNINSDALKKMATGLVVEKLDLYGLDFMWQIALETPCEEIADQAIKQLMKMCYTNLSRKLKKDPVALHKSFIAQCYQRLEQATITIGGTAVAFAISQATKTLTAATVPGVAAIPSPLRAAKLLVIERLLKLAETYITTVEDQHLAPRTILPHGASYQGQPITMQVVCDSPKYDFILVGHGNETLQSVRQRIAQRMRTTIDNIQIAANERMLMSNKYPKLLRQLEFEDQQLLTVKQFGTSVSRIDESIPFTGRQNYITDLERSLPGVVMATGGQVFEMLYQLAELEGSRLTERVRNLLMLIPTDPTVQEALDSICRQTEGTSVDWGDSLNSPKETSKATLESLFKTNSQSMSAFRLLYNLEVLSSRLVPSLQEDKATQASAQTFRENFLSAGGLSLVISVLQKESIPQDLDEETRRGCYMICLHLARFLLCGETTTAEMESDLSLTEGQANLSADSATGALSSSYGTSPRKMSLVERMSSVEASGDVANREGTSKAIAVIQTMSTSDFSSMIGCLMRVCWAAAAGQLRLASSAHQIKENPGGGFAMGVNRRSRHSSTGSSSSDADVQSLHAGVCLLATHVSTKDAMIAREALELLVACLQLRSHNLSSFYHMPAMSDFVIDILLACPHSEVRTAAMEQFHTLSETGVNPESIRTLHPRHFLLQVLLSVPVPLWTSSCLVRGTNQRIIMQCSQYFELRCRLLEQLTVDDQRFLDINPTSMITDEIDWLNNFEPCDSEESSFLQTDNIIIAGHLQLAKTLLTCEGVDKKKIGKQLLDKLLNEFLFPASRLILDSSSNPDKLNPQAEHSPKISGRESRVAAFDLLLVLCEDCPENLQLVSCQLIAMHHQQDPAIAKEWDYLPPVEGRSPSNYVGLKNGGATCYMNSVIQQLYMTPGVREGLLKDSNLDLEEDSVFYQMQMVFGHLLESRLQYYEPERFWRVFKLWGQPVNIREQQDAFEFFTNLTDQMEEYLKKNKQKEIFKPKFKGVFSDQKICEDCPHRYEREEEFFALNLTVKSHSLESSLDQFVRGELLDGDNAYFCEKCNEKRNTIKRMCIKTLPPVLVIQLKRFDYDWEAGRALKFDDYFKFPWVLDMEPYTVKGMARRESPQSDEASSGEMPDNSQPHTMEDLYHLVGVIVHSGQANAGHYYSFIKDRWGTTMTNSNKGKWFKFNDTMVDEFEMSDAALEAECFGGSYKPKIYEPSGSSYSSETRLRYWNGYMLFYERLEGAVTPVGPAGKVLAGTNRVTLLKQDSEGEIHVLDPISSPELSPRHDGDRLSELTALVRKGEHRGMFMDRMPPGIQRVIRDDNLQFLRNRAIYDMDYFNFVRNLASCNMAFTLSSHYDSCAVTSLQLAFQFLFNNYFRTKKKLRCDVNDWCNCVDQLVANSREGSSWALTFMASPQGHTYIKQFLLESPTREVRIAFARIMQYVLQGFVHCNRAAVSGSPPLNSLVEYLLSLLDKEVPDHCKTCQQYFWLLSSYLDTHIECCKQLFSKSAFRRIVTFLLGPHTPENEEDVQTRRWTSLQTHEFTYLHTMLAVMVLYCDVSKFRTIDQGDFPPRQRTLIIPTSKPLAMPSDMQQILAGTEGIKYIREVILMFREVPAATTALLDMLLHCCYCNETFTLSVMMMIHGQVSAAPTNELKHILILLLELLMMEDPLQGKRLKLAVEGHSNNGLLEIIRKCTSTDSRRSYQCIKFLVHLSNKCPMAKEYLMTISVRWQWAVNWLKKKMSEHYWTPQNVSNESSTGRSFQRTMSAQDTLAEATALLDELNTRDDEEAEEEEEFVEGDSNTKMEVNGSSEGSEVNGNEDSSESSKTLVQDDVGDLDDIDT
ncbi:ubiquitin carboxyl-terminal hydrolase 24-like isoform X2 [Acanthaster planci]|uniref:ubiquitinyl hydrolase 1 n=1 Tax=Acanthaster planci TaxID=133434 RepID=A0A8B7ZEI3_ACAPL|nr:ubiquitin carboxyl-terminal hydrolase 24-like isoform X2 [Acanthaster planci]